MRFFFLETDSFYKVFKTLEKIPSKKSITIFIEENNDIFKNDRWAKQIKNLLESKEITATFVAKTEKTKKYFEENWLNFEYKYKNKRVKLAHITYLFFFNIKKFHQALYNQKHYTAYLLFGLEVSILLIVLYMLYALILPSTKITITPNYQVEDIIYNFRYYPVSEGFFPSINTQLSIPYYSWSFEYVHTMASNIATNPDEQKPAKGTITLYNETPTGYSIIKNTKFVTPNGLSFTADEAFTIPAGSVDNKSSVQLKVTASPSDIFGNSMGPKGNIQAGTAMHIKNLKDSYFLKKIYAIADHDFTGWVTLSQWVVSQQDINELDEKLRNYIITNKKDILRKNFDIPNAVLLHYDNLITVTTQPILVKQKIWDKWPSIEGSIKSNFNFLYVKQSDIVKSILQYISQRQADTQLLIDINIQSLILYDIKNTQDDILIIPTSVSIIRGYNFETDKNGIKNKIKNTIIGKTESEAQSLLQAYPEIGTTQLTIRPPWYKTIPTTKSRITFDIKK